MNGNWLLYDFHIHTRFSDGSLFLEEVVDLYGTKGFYVITISDHILDSNSWDACTEKGQDPRVIPENAFQDYLQLLWREARRAWETYRMLLIPGTEITNNTGGCHILAVDIKDYIDPGSSVEI